LGVEIRQRAVGSGLLRPYGIPAQREGDRRRQQQVRLLEAIAPGCGEPGDEFEEGGPQAARLLRGCLSEGHLGPEVVRPRVPALFQPIGVDQPRRGVLRGGDYALEQCILFSHAHLCRLTTQLSSRLTEGGRTRGPSFARHFTFLSAITSSL